MLRTEQKKVVILEKDHAQRDFLRSVVAADSGLAFCFDRVALCFDNLAQLNPDLIVVGSFPRNSILRFINAHKATNCNLPSLLMTQDIEIKKYLEINGVSNIRMCESNLKFSTFNKSVAYALKQNTETPYDKNCPFIVGNSSDIIKIKEILPVMNMSRESVLIEGEKGIGKEMIARAIHRLSGDKDLFVKISAQEIQPGSSRLNLLEIIGRKIRNEINSSNPQFPHEVMSTILIDELGYLPDSIQSELLDIVDNGHDLPHCFSSGVKNKLRIISTTSVGSDYLLSENRLRKDLFYRLNVLNFKMSPLRQRKEDIPLLVDYFSFGYCKLLGRSFFELPSEAIDIFMDYHWPGNTKELETIVKRAVMNGDDGKFLKDLHLVNTKASSKTDQKMIEDLKACSTIDNERDYLKQVEKTPLKEICSNFLAKVEKKVMRKALESTNWNRKKAAAMLNISYKSMLNKIKEYGLA
ncbi:sigma-54-dependent transcriptional regulator [Thermodesulfobacteriota bacterium]